MKAYSKYLLIAGQFLTADVIIDEDNQLMKLNDGQPMPVKKAPIWLFIGIAGDC